MIKNPYPGKFIVFEGLDGSGNSTQAELLKKYLQKKGFKVLLTKEPTQKSLAGKKIRKVLEKKEKTSPFKLQKLFVQDRKEHLRNEILPALKQNKIVISDRYFFSTFAFGAAEGLSLNRLIKLNEKFPFPDLTFILDAKPKTCIQRIEKRGKKKTLFEKEAPLKKTRGFYKIFPKRFKDHKIFLINAEKPIKEVFKEIKKIINKELKNMKTNQIAKIIDHTNIKPEATAKDIKKTCQEAIRFGFRGVCVNPEWVKLAAQELKGSDIKVVVLIDPPIGDSSHKQRVKLCQKAKKDGADEIDIVIPIVDVKHERWAKILKELKEICKILPTKVIIGSGYLTDSEIKKVSEIVKKAGAICVKTSTFKDPLDHFELLEKARHLKIMKEAAPGLLIKAAGKIRTLDDLKMMVQAGADIIGTSSSVQIMEQAQKKPGE